MLRVSMHKGNKNIISRQTNKVFKPHGGPLNIVELEDLRIYLDFVYWLSLVHDLLLVVWLAEFHTSTTFN